MLKKIIGYRGVANLKPLGSFTAVAATDGRTLALKGSVQGRTVNYLLVGPGYVDGVATLEAAGSGGAVTVELQQVEAGVVAKVKAQISGQRVTLDVLLSEPVTEDTMLGAALQGLLKLLDTIKNNPLKTLAAAAALVVLRRSM